MATPKIIADFETQLSTALAVGGTSFTLASATDDDGVALPSGAYYFTIDNGSSNKEYVLGTLASTAVTAVFSVSRQGTETSGVVRAHRVGASVIMTDFATYKKYMDGIALVSAPDGDASTKGVYQMATQAQTDAGTIVGSTNSNLVVNPSTQRGRAYNDYAADAGVSDAYAITVTPAITAYATGQVFTFKANTANTGAATLAVSGLAAKDIRKNVSAVLATGDILASQILTVVYDGTNFQVVSKVSPTQSMVATIVRNSGSATKNLADADAATTVVAHGLGVAPVKVRMRTLTSSTTIFVVADGTWANSAYTERDLFSDNAGNPVANVSTSYILNLKGVGTSSAFQTATIAVDATNLTLTWAKTNAPTGTITILWEAEGYTTA